MRIEVTQTDIDRGVREDCRSCPVALAITRQVGVAVLVDDERVVFLPGHAKSESADLPYEVARFIDSFDSGEPVGPFAFNLNVPEFV